MTKQYIAVFVAILALASIVFAVQEGGTGTENGIFFRGDVTVRDLDNSSNSPILQLMGKSAIGNELYAQARLVQAADPYFRLDVTDQAATPSMVDVIHIHDNAILFSADNAVDIGATGATRPKDIWAAGDINAAGALNGASGDFAEGNITNVGSIAVDTITPDGTSIAYGTVDKLSLTQEDVGATCSRGQLRYDTAGTHELLCANTNTWSCISFTTTNGPTD